MDFLKMPGGTYSPRSHASNPNIARIATLTMVSPTVYSLLSPPKPNRRGVESIYENRVIKYRRDAWGNTYTMARSWGEPGVGRIGMITTPYNQSVVRTFVSSGPAKGWVAVEDEKNAAGQVVRRTRNTYWASGQGCSTDCGSDGDLVMVETFVRESDDDYTQSGDQYFGIREVIQYRYYRSGDDDGLAHQMKMVLEADAIEQILEDNQGLSAESLLTKADSFNVAGGKTVAEYANRSFVYYTSTIDTSSSLSTAFSGVGTENLGQTYGGADMDETGRVKSETVHGDCGSCGGAGGDGMTRTYYYMDLNGGSSGNPNEVIRITIEDTVDSEGQFVRRKIFGLNQGGRALREVTAIGTSASPQYWCTSTVLGGIGGTGAEAADDWQVIERRQVSAHTKVTAGLIDEFLDPTGNSGDNDADTLNGAQDEVGLVYVTGYNANGFPDQQRIRNTQSGTEYYIEAITYGDGTNDALYRVKSTVKYLTETPSPSPGNDYLQTTSYDYWYWNDDLDTPKVKKTTYGEVPTAQNGSGVATTSWEYFDDKGRLRWTKDPAGSVTYYAYNVSNGSLAYMVRDVKTDSMGNDLEWIASPPSGEWTAWSGGAPYAAGDYDFTTSAGLNLASRTSYDASGRPRMRVEPDGTTTYTVYLDKKTLIFPSWDDTADASRLPIRVSETDAAGNVVLSYTVAPACVDLDANDLPIGLDGETQADYFTLTRNNYNAKGQLESIDRYHAIPDQGGDGSLGTNYYRTSYAYDSQGRRLYTTAPDGTIALTQYDALGRPTAGWIGTNAEDAAWDDPAGSGNNNMVKVSETYYDGATTLGALVVGGGHVTATRQVYGSGGNDYYETKYNYDWRGRRTCVRGPDEITTQQVLDNQGRAILTASYTDPSNLFTKDAGEKNISVQTSLYDKRGQVYRTSVYSIVNGATGSDKLTTNYWYDAAGRQIKAADPNGLFTKTAYDSVGRAVKTYVCHDDGGETTYAEAGNVDDDTVISQTELQYDSGGRVIWTITHQRNSAGTGTGALTTNNARREYAGNWYDDAGRLTHSTYFGDNGTTAMQWSSTRYEPDTSDDRITTRYDYDSAGRQYRVTDNMGVKTTTLYNDLGRATDVYENHVNGGTPGYTDYSQDRRTEYVFDSAGRLSILRAYNPKGTSVEQQETQYIYDPTASQASPAVYRNDLPTGVVYPDSDDAFSSGSWSGNDHVEIAYDRLGRKIAVKDQRQIVHQYTYDDAGRLIADSVANGEAGQPGWGDVDATVKSITYTYDDIGRRTKVTSHGDYTADPTDTSDIESQIVYAYDGDDSGDTGWGGVKTSWQSHADEAVTSGQDESPKVAYAYADGAAGGEAKYVRLTQATYPNGREVYYNYQSSGVDAVLGRVYRIAEAASPSDAQTYARYTYMGTGTIMKVEHPQIGPNNKLDLIYNSTGAYPGRDRFGRVIRQMWWNSYTSSSTDFFHYGYDRASNRIWRDNVVAGQGAKHKDEYYAYDELHRLTAFERGDLDAQFTEIEANKERAEVWDLEALGNWYAYQYDDDGDGNVAGDNDLDQTRTHNKVNELTALAAGQYQSAWADPTYDAAGNMTSGPKATGIVAGATRVHHVWDAWNRLAEVWQDDGDGTLETGGDDTLLLTCRYDGRHRRIAKTDEVAETTYDYYYNESWQCLEERKDGEPYVQYVWDLRYIDAPVCRFRDLDDDGQTDDETLYYTNDANMNVTALVDTSGAVVERYVYDPYGRVKIYDGTWTNEQSAATYANDILYCGYRYDRETGLYQVRYRYYHPGLGRWVSRDPIGYVDGMNLAEYCGGRAINRYDPDGLWYKYYELSKLKYEKAGKCGWLINYKKCSGHWYEGEGYDTCTYGNNFVEDSSACPGYLEDWEDLVGEERDSGSWVDWVPILSTVKNWATAPKGSNASDYARFKPSRKVCCESGEASAQYDCERKINGQAMSYMVGIGGDLFTGITGDLTAAILATLAKRIAAQGAAKAAGTTWIPGVGWVIGADALANAAATVVNLFAIHDAAKEAIATYCRCPAGTTEN